MKTISRFLGAQLSKRIGQNKVLLIYGTRRVGKTNMLRILEAENKEKCLMLNCEDHDIRQLLANQTARNYKSILADKTLILLDEAQVITNIGQHLKFMIDTFPEITIIATGSSSFDLMNQSGEPLTGRSYQYNMYALSFGELVKENGFIDTYQQIEDLLIYGSYPEIQLIESKQYKEKYLKELVNNYLLKDILAFENIRNANKILDLLQLIAYQTGSEVSIQELGNQLGISKNTVERYLDLLTKVFVLFKVGGYSKNLRKEIVKSSKWYFWDLGLRNALVSDFRPLEYRPDKGLLWENYCFSERIKFMHYNNKKPEYYFWRTYDGQEVDMIEILDNTVKAYEFKYKKKANIKPPAAFSTNYPEVVFTYIDKENIAELLME
jgi:predicted AAA+ superfamily ATPase